MEIWLTIFNINVSLVIPFQIIWASDNVKNYLLRKFSFIQAIIYHIIGEPIAILRYCRRSIHPHSIYVV